MSRRFTEAEIAEVWERREAGELTPSIARRLGSERVVDSAVVRGCRWGASGSASSLGAASFIDRAGGDLARDGGR